MPQRGSKSLLSASEILGRISDLWDWRTIYAFWSKPKPCSVCLSMLGIILNLALTSQILFANEEQIVIPLGRSVFHALGGQAHPVRVSSGRILRVTSRGSHFSLYGKAKGRATIVQGQRIWNVTVISGPTSQLYQALSTLLSNKRGLILTMENEAAVVGGTLLRLQDWTELAEAQLRTGGRWHMQAQPDSNLLHQLNEFLRARRVSAQYNFSIRPYPHLEVTKSNLPLAQSDPVVQSLGLKITALPNELAEQSLLQIQLYLTEIQKSAGARIGLDYQDGQELRLLPKVEPPTSFLASLRFLASTGEAKILATPTLTVKSGSEAEYLVGGEFALRGRKGSRAEVQWKRYGLILKFLPLVLPSGQISLSFESEFSHPDFSQSVEGIPSLRTSRTKTAINLPLNRMVLASGLLRDQSGGSQSGLNGLKDIPIFGQLFASQDFQKQKSQFELFVQVVRVDANFDDLNGE